MLKRFRHHFTKTELALEEIIIVFLICVLFAVAALGAEGLLPIKVSIIRCVTPEERALMCQQRDLCCHLIDKPQNPSLELFPNSQDPFGDEEAESYQGAYPDTYEGHTLLQ